MTERQTTCRQFIDGHDVPGPVSPKGDGWRLTHVAAASGRATVRDDGFPMCALIFYVWERDTT